MVVTTLQPIFLPWPGFFNEVEICDGHRLADPTAAQGLATSSPEVRDGFPAGNPDAAEVLVAACD